jgi:ferredoxin
MARDHAAFHLHVVYMYPEGDDLAGRDFQHTGHVSVDLLRKTLPHGRHTFYVCGPPAVMEAIVPALADWGVSPQDIHFEAFGPASVRLPGQTLAPANALLPSPYEIRFTGAGRTLVWDGTEGNLLDFAEHHGVEVPSGCRSGSCGSCETRLLSGAVVYANKPDFDVAPGACLLCVGTPASDLALGA